MSLRTDLPCRSCGSEQLDEILSLGTTPLANSLLTSEQVSRGEEPVFPLDVVFCRRCSLVQLTETVPPEVLFSDYLYFSSFSDTVLKNARENVDQLLASRGLTSESFVVEIASNDGYLLKNYQAAGIRVLGIEPATNIARVATEKGIPTRNEFFGADAARRLVAEGIWADVVHANNVLAHVADLNGVIEGFSVLLKETGVAVIEVPYVKDMIDHCEFDTIYHEHLCYFSLTALEKLFQRHGMFVEDVERIAIHGGSLRVYAAPRTPSREPTERARELLNEERRWGIDRLPFYSAFARRVEQLRSDLLALLTDLKSRGLTIAAYGAAAKGSTLLNYCGIGAAFLDFVVDRSTHKQGRFMPGIHLPIYSPQRLLEVMPDAVLLLSWNFAEEVMKQQEEYRLRGGKFIVPVPKPMVIDFDIDSVIGVTS